MYQLQVLTVSECQWVRMSEQASGSHNGVRITTGISEFRIQLVLNVWLRDSSLGSLLCSKRKQNLQNVWNCPEYQSWQVCCYILQQRTYFWRPRVICA